jgi:hypothetical protein
MRRTLRARGVISPSYANDAGFNDLVVRGEAHERETGRLP